MEKEFTGNDNKWANLDRPEKPLVLLVVMWAVQEFTVVTQRISEKILIFLTGTTAVMRGSRDKIKYVGANMKQGLTETQALFKYL